ncbi:hypothetical protein B0H13DRAFT_65220 [Mycena leptocephala]|nr:hypothetical protein B0H13DRAFT_65220 [Mycena leptocephala]
MAWGTPPLCCTMCWDIAFCSRHVFTLLRGQPQLRRRRGRCGASSTGAAGTSRATNRDPKGFGYGKFEDIKGAKKT